MRALFCRQNLILAINRVLRSREMSKCAEQFYSANPCHGFADREDVVDRGVDIRRLLAPVSHLLLTITSQSRDHLFRERPAHLPRHLLARVSTLRLI